MRTLHLRLEAVSTRVVLMDLERTRAWARRFWEPGDTLSERVVKSGFWVVAFRIAGRLGTLCRTVVLARILAPSDFGFMGIALLAISVLDTISQPGFGYALIQREGRSEEYLDTAWTVSVVRGVLLCVVLFLSAPWVARFFDVAAVGLIVRVTALSVLLNGLTNPGVLYFQKDLEFNRQFLYRVSGTAADLVVAIAAGLLLRSVWALVLGLVARSLVQLVVSYALHSYRPTVRFESGQARDLFSFGRWIFGSHVIVMLVRQGDHALVGRLVGATGLGYYQMATHIAVAPATEIADQICQVAFPTFAKVQGRRELIAKIYGMTFQGVVLLSLPLAGGMLVLAREITQVFLGSQWLPMVPALRVLSVFGVARAINSLLRTTFDGAGRPAISTTGLGAQLVLLAAVIYPLVMRQGVVGASVAVTAAELLFLLYGAFKVRCVSGQTLGQFMEPVRIGVFSAATMALVVLALRHLTLNRMPTYLALSALVPVGGIVYLGMVLLLDRSLMSKLAQLVRVL